MKRKDFFKGLAIGTIATPFVIRGLTGKSLAQNNGSANIITNKKYQWKMVTTWPPGFPVIGESCQLFADVVKAMSGGRMEIRVYGGGELVPALEVFDAVASGTAQIGNGAGYYWAGKSPAAQFFASVPFGMNAQQVTSWIVAGGGIQLWEELYRDFGLVPMVGGNTGVQMGGWFNREINSIKDLKGLKMRMPGLGGDVLAKAGGSPVLLAGGEIYTSLELGVIDATEWISPYHDYLMGFQDIAKYYYTPGWHEPGTALEYIFNKKEFDALPTDLQAILRSAAMHSYVWMFSQMEARNAETLTKLMGEGIDIRTFPPEVLAQLRVYTKEVIASMTEKDAFTKRVYDSYNDFRKKATNWADISEKQFYNSLEM
ncbi:MAG: TRAP transporter substrate-binding protein [Saprospiraceae bacterium]|nr:TRAP transporter substrate-binding protein [Saprospiraceae bacterium]